MSRSDPVAPRDSKAGTAGASQLKDQINRGQGGDKVPYFDPAASPLGTDDEAAGMPPSAEEAGAALKAENRRSDPAGASEKTLPEQQRHVGRNYWLGLAVITLTAFGALIAILSW